MKSSIKDFFSKYDQIVGNLMEDFIFCVVEHIPTVIWDIRTGY